MQKALKVVVRNIGAEVHQRTYPRISFWIVIKMAVSFFSTILRYTIAQNQTILVQGWESGSRVRSKDKISRKLTAWPGLVKSMLRRVRLAVKMKPEGDNDGQGKNVKVDQEDYKQPRHGAQCLELPPLGCGSKLQIHETLFKKTNYGIYL